MDIVRYTDLYQDTDRSLVTFRILVWTLALFLSLKMNYHHDMQTNIQRPRRRQRSLIVMVESC